jgi:hypothetical protein
LRLAVINRYGILVHADGQPDPEGEVVGPNLNGALNGFEATVADYDFVSSFGERGGLKLAAGIGLSLSDYPSSRRDQFDRRCGDRRVGGVANTPGTEVPAAYEMPANAMPKRTSGIPWVAY